MSPSGADPSRSDRSTYRPPAPAAEATLPALLERHARDRGDRLALVLEGDGRALTYRDLRDTSGRLAASLAHRGIGPGTHVVVFVPPGRPLYLLLLALFRLGATTVLVDPGMGRERIEQALALAEPEAFIGIARAHFLRFRSKALARVRLHVSVGGLAPGALPFAALLGDARGPAPRPAIAPETPALLTFTSGTTGRPRGAVRTHGFLLAQHAALRETLGSRPDDVDVHGLPVFLLHTLAGGATALLPRLAGGGPAPARPGDVVRLVRRYGATTMVGASTFLAPIVAWCRRRGVALPGVRGAFAGGAVVPPSLVAGLRELLPDGDAYVVYGSTEAEPIAIIGGRELAEDGAPGAQVGRGACVGRPADCVRLRLDGQPGPALGPVGEAGEVGEVLVAGAHVNPGYYRAPEADRAAKVRDADGTIWHRTGDCAWQDARGRLWLVGRRGDAIPRPGGALWPFPVEGAAEAVPGVARAALCALGDRGDGTERAVLAVVPEGGIRRGIRRNGPLLRRVQERLEALGLPVDEVRATPSVPLDRRHRAKIDRRALVRQLSSSAARLHPM